MEHKAKDFSSLLGQLKGLSDKQLTAHFGLYEGYVKKWNEIQAKLATQDKSATNYSFGEFSELKRREAVAFNGTFLHEAYFENLAGEKDAGEISPELKKAITAAFGSMETFEQDMKSSAASTPGWVVLTWNRPTNKLHTFIMYEHHIGLPVHQDLVLALDCWEHAFMIDYGTKKAEYLNAFFDNINWNEVNRRFEALQRKA